MGWTRNDDDMLDHQKWRRAIRHGGDGVLLLWQRLTSWCSRRLTDGVVPGDMVDEIGELGSSKTRAKQLRALVDASLLAWHDPAEDSTDLRRGLAEPSPRPRREGDDLVVVGYLQRNPTRAKVLAERDRRAQSQKNYEDRKNLTGSGLGQGSSSLDESRPDPDDVPARPGPARPVPTPIPDLPSVDPERAEPASPAPAAPAAAEPARAQPFAAAPSTATEPTTEIVGPDPPSKRGRSWKRVPPGWVPNESHRKRAVELGWGRTRFDREAEKYRLHDFKVGHTDADRTFHAWMLRADDDEPAQPRRSQLGHQRSGNSDAVAYAIQLGSRGEP